MPAYDPWDVYGAPLAAYPDWVAVPGTYFAGPDLYFGLGVGLFAGFAWGWNDWGFDWHDRRVEIHHAPYFSHSRTFANRHDFDQRGAHFDHRPAPFDHTPDLWRRPIFRLSMNIPERKATLVGVSGAFSGFDHGGIARGSRPAGGRVSVEDSLQAGGFQQAEIQGWRRPRRRWRLSRRWGGGGFHGGGVVAAFTAAVVAEAPTAAEVTGNGIVHEGRNC